MPSLVPGTDSGNWPQYFVLCDYGHKLGLAWAEVDPREADRETVLRLLLHGEFTNPITVMEVNLPAGTCRDVTSDVMEEIEARAEAA